MVYTETLETYKEKSISTPETPPGCATGWEYYLPQGPPKNQFFERLNLRTSVC